MKWKTVLIFAISLLLAGLLVIILGDITDYTPYESYDNGHYYFNAVGFFGILPMWGGFVLLLFVVARGKCKWCESILGKQQTYCPICKDKVCSARCFYEHKERRH